MTKISTVIIHKDTVFYGLERSGICYISYFCLNSILFHQTVGKILYLEQKSQRKELDLRCWQASPQKLADIGAWCSNIQLILTSLCS